MRRCLRSRMGNDEQARLGPWALVYGDLIHFFSNFTHSVHFTMGLPVVSSVIESWKPLSCEKRIVVLV